MPRYSFECVERFEGPISGLRLPMTVWNHLLTEGITTLDHLTVMADRLEQFVGIGPKTARMIREELARVAAPQEQP